MLLGFNNIQGVEITLAAVPPFIVFTLGSLAASVSMVGR